MKFTVNLKIALAMAVIVSLAMGVTIYVVQSRVQAWFESDARSSLSVQSTLLVRQIRDRNTRLEAATQALTKRDNLISNVILVDEILKEDAMSAFDVAYIEMNQVNADTLRLQAEQNNLDAMFMVSSGGIMTSFYSASLQKEGWLTGEQLFTIKDLASDSLVEGVILSEVLAELNFSWEQMSIHAKESLAYNESLSMKWMAPVVDQFDETNIGGYLVSIDSYNQPYAEELKSLIGADINFYMNDQIAHGTYPLHDALQLEQLIGDPALVEESGYVVRDLFLKGEDYFSVLIPVYDNGVLDGALAVFSSKNWLLARLDEVSVVLGLLGLGVGVFGVMFVSVLSRFITKPLKEMIKVISRVESEGNFALRINVRSNDEVGDGVKVINHLLTNLQDNVDNINQTMNGVSQGDLTQRVCADAKGNLLELKESINASLGSLGNAMKLIAEGTAEVGNQTAATSAAADDVATGAEDQLNSINLLSTAVRESTKAIEEVATHTEEASVKANDSVAEVVNGKNLLEETRNIISIISNNSQKIHGITGSIQDIAEQTNLLALNAAIEAARAGEQGRGFAVVADEVRNLASKASKCANEITILATEAVDSGAQAVSASGQAQEGMDKIEFSVCQMKELLESISVAMDEQSMTLVSIDHSVSTLREIGSENSSASQSINNAVSALSRVAQENTQQVGNFTV